MSIAIGKMLDRSGYLQDLRDERSEDAEGRVENLAELVSAAREYESREPEPSLGGFVDRLSLLSDVDEEAGIAGRARLDDDAAQRQGPRVSRSSSSPASKKDCSRTRGRARTKRSSRKSGGSATSA